MWHREAKSKRIAEATAYATERNQELATFGPTLELALAMLYLGEGTKQEKGLVLGNSNAMVLQFYMEALRSLYKIDEGKFRFELHLRADHTENREIEYWSRALEVKPRLFRRVYRDSRSTGKPSHADYHGVCVVFYGDVAIQRKLMYLYSQYCRKVIDMRG